MSLVESTKKAYAGLMSSAIELGGGLLVIAIVVGTIAIPLFIGVDTSSWTLWSGSPTLVLIWGTILTIMLAALIMGIIGMFRKSGE